MVAVLVLGGCGGSSSGSAGSVAAGRAKPTVEAPKGPPPTHLVVEDLIEGQGKPAEPGDELTVEYVGIFYDGSKFTDSWERAKPFRFRLGGHANFVDPSWQRGLRGMRLGGRRELIVPPAARGAPPGTPPSETLVYVIDLVGLE